MDINEQFDKHQEIIKKEANMPFWEEKGMLANIESEEIKLKTALLLSNQKLLKELSPDLEVPDSIEITSKIFPFLLAHKLIGTHVQLGPICECYHKNLKEEIDSTTLATKTRKIKIYQDHQLSNDEFANEIKKQIDLEILTDLYNNVETVGTYKLLNKSISYEDFYLKLMEIVSIIRVKTTSIRKKFWIVIGQPELSKQYELIEQLKKRNTFFELHIVPEFDKPGFLIGCCGDKDNYDAGYFWNQYMLLCKTPIISYISAKPGYLMRYSKTLINNKYYAKLIIE